MQVMCFVQESAHAAMMCEIPELCHENPNVKNWNLCTLHFNSYFKVMDVYEKEGVKQVFLLHIPGAAAFFLGHDETAMNFVNEATGQETTLIEMARRSLDEKMKMEVHPRSLDKEFVERMHHPIGLDEEYYPVNPNEQEEPTDGPIANLSSMIHKLANDADLKDFINVEDNFPYRGVSGTVCEGCIYANGIQGKGEGCGRLFIKSFRERYLKGRCEYRKTDIAKPSFFEEMDMYHKKIEKEKVEKACDTYALNKLKKFVAERLDGDIKKLKDFDFYTLREDTEFGEYNKASAAGFDESEFDRLLATADAYGKSTIYCTYEFASQVVPTSSSAINWNAMSDGMKEERWNNGYFTRYKNHNMIVLPQSFESADNAKKVIDPRYAWIIPTGSEKPVKVAFEGQTAVREHENADWSREIQTYKKFGVAVFNVNPGLCVYKNTALSINNKPGTWTAN